MFLGVLMVGVPFSLLLGGFLYLPYYLWHRKERRPVWRHLTVYAWLCFTILVLDATLLIGGIDFAPTYHFLNLAPFEWIRHPYELSLIHISMPMLSQRINDSPGRIRRDLAI